MSIVDQLEPYEAEPLTIADARAAAGRRNMLKNRSIIADRSRRAIIRSYLLSSKTSHVPTLPRVKWLERPDP